MKPVTTAAPLSPQPQPVPRLRALPHTRVRRSEPAALLLSWAMLAAVFIAALVWAAYAPIAVTATAMGKIAPPDRVQIISQPEGGAVHALHVRVGQHVKAGDVLVELDPEAAAADLGQLETEASGYLAEVRRLEAERDGRQPDFTGIPDDKAREQMALFQARRARHEGDLRVAQDELRVARATIAGAQAALDPLRKRLSGRRELAAQGYDSQFQVNEDESRIGELTGRLEEGQANAELAQAHIAATEQTYQEDIAKTLADDRNHLSTIERLRPKYEHHLDVMQVVAPVDGVIKTVAVTGVGAVVKPGEPIVELVPDDAERLVVAKLPAADVGHVRPGQKVRITLFPPDSRLRPLDGTVQTVAPDSAPDERTGQLNYVVEISPSANRFSGDKGDDNYPLVTGVPVSVTILDGERTVLAAICGPLFSSLDDTLTER